jgi:hypothetical protein
VRSEMILWRDRLTRVCIPSFLKFVSTTFNYGSLRFSDALRNGQGPTYSTGNTTYELPSLHVLFGIPGGDIYPHDAEFARFAATEDAFQCAIRAGKAMASTGWKILTDDRIYAQCRADFEEDKATR